MARSREITGLVVAVIVTSLAMGAAVAQYADGRVYIDRGRAYLKKGDNDRAIADFTQAIQLDPKNADAYVKRGFGYSKKGDNDRAIADFTHAIQLDPKNADAYEGRGNGYLINAAKEKDSTGRTLGDNDRAIADYTKVIQLDPKNAEAYYSRGIAYYFKGYNDLAVADHIKAKKLQHAALHEPSPSSALSAKR
jgi:tetratricopeptide (TPR) repeat protein